MDEATEAFRKMLIWRKEKNVDEYFKKVEAVNFDVHKVPLADVFEPLFKFSPLIVVFTALITIIRKIKKDIS